VEIRAGREEGVHYSLGPALLLGQMAEPTAEYSLYTDTAATYKWSGASFQKNNSWSFLSKDIAKHP
jgi:hypothetical protein